MFLRYSWPQKKAGIPQLFMCMCLEFLVANSLCTIVEGAFLFEGQQQHGVHSLIRKKISLQQLFYITKLFGAGHFSDLFLTEN